jgi:hypothetical protein
LITHRISGDTLASNDNVAMTPTIQPAAAGTQRYRELDRPPERDAERGVARVTDREDIPSNREMPDEAQESQRLFVCAPRTPVPQARTLRASPPAAEVLEDSSGLLNLPGDHPGESQDS